jgi:hypothetical protein
MTMGDEVWKPIPGFDGYLASTAGRVKNRRGVILTGTVTRDGYCQLNVRHGDRRRTVLAHRLVATAFHGEPPPGFVCNHLSGQKLVNRPDLLEWTTPAGNAAHARALGLVRPPAPVLGERNHKARLTPDDVRLMRELRRAGATHKELAARFGVTDRNVRFVVSRRTWRHVD